MCAHSGRVIGQSVEAAFNFIVHEPRGIIPWVSEKSRFSSFLV